LNGSPSAIAFDPNNPQIIYMGDFISGSYRSEDGGFTWNKINNGLTFRNIVDLIITQDGDHLYAGTFGGGVFRLDLTGQPLGGIDESPPEPESTSGDSDSPFSSLPCMGGLGSFILVGAAWVLQRQWKEN
jgi:hypothetical protein